MKEKDEMIAEDSHTELSGLKDSLRQAIDDGDIKRAGELKVEILPHLNILKREMEMPISFEEAKEIMEDDFMGPEDIGKTFGPFVKPEKVPNIPFTKNQLEKAKELGQFLILRVDKYKDRKSSEEKPFNVSSMLYWSNIANSLDYNGVKIDISETPRPGWALVEKDFVPFTANLNYMEQLKRSVEHLKRQVGKDYAGSYDEAVKEFEDQEMAIVEEIGKGAPSEEILRKIMSLKASKLLMPSFTEAAYDMIMYCKKNGVDNMLGDSGGEVVTRSLAKDGVGAIGVSFDKDTITLSGVGIGRRSINSGFLFSRRT